MRRIWIPLFFAVAVLGLIEAAPQRIASASDATDSVRNTPRQAQHPDTLSVRNVLCVPHIMVSKLDRFYIQLVDSTTLLIDKRTPGGRHIMLDGRVLDLAVTQRYPRAFSICTYLR